VLENIQTTPPSASTSDTTAAEPWEEDFAMCDANGDEVINEEEAVDYFLDICWAACNSTSGYE